MTRYALVAVAAVLASCAAPVDYERELGVWAGAQEVELVRNWGPPSTTYEAGGRKFIVYRTQRTIHIPGTAPGLIGGTPTYDVELTCTTAFELADRTVVSWSHQGNDCSARKGRFASR